MRNRKSRLDFAKSGLDFTKSGLDFVKSGLDFAKSGLDFAKSGHPEPEHPWRAGPGVIDAFERAPERAVESYVPAPRAP